MAGPSPMPCLAVAGCGVLTGGMLIGASNCCIRSSITSAEATSNIGGIEEVDVTDQTTWWPSLNAIV
jgi:hypothetical protein